MEIGTVKSKFKILFNCKKKLGGQFPWKRRLKNKQKFLCGYAVLVFIKAITNIKKPFYWRPLFLGLYLIKNLTAYY